MRLALNTMTHHLSLCIISIKLQNTNIKKALTQTGEDGSKYEKDKMDNAEIPNYETCLHLLYGSLAPVICTFSHTNITHKQHQS